MNTVPLAVLIDAVAALKMLREVADEHLKGEQYIQALRAWSSLKVHVEHISREIKVEAQA